MGYDAPDLSMSANSSGLAGDTYHAVVVKDLDLLLDLRHTGIDLGLKFINRVALGLDRGCQVVSSENIPKVPRTFFLLGFGLDSARLLRRGRVAVLGVFVGTLACGLLRSRLAVFANINLLLAATSLLGS